MASKNKGISPSKFEWITAKRREVITQEKMGWENRFITGYKYPLKMTSSINGAKIMADKAIAIFSEISSFVIKVWTISCKFSFLGSPVDNRKLEIIEPMNTAK